MLASMQLRAELPWDALACPPPHQIAQSIQSRYFKSGLGCICVQKVL
jgi:hypothetical protein